MKIVFENKFYNEPLKITRKEIKMTLEEYIEDRNAENEVYVFLKKLGADEITATNIAELDDAIEKNFPESDWSEEQRNYALENLQLKISLTY